MSSQSTSFHHPRPPVRKLSLSTGTFPHSVTVHDLPTAGAARIAQGRSSRTWTTSSGELGLLSDTDEVDDRSGYVQEYNRLAKKVCSSWCVG